MKKVVLSTLLAVASTALVQNYAVAQQAVNTGSQPSGQQQITLPPEQVSAYNAAEGKTDPGQKAAALDAFLTQYPDTPVKKYVLADEMTAYSQVDPAKTLATADKLLQIEPNNLRALTMEVYFRKAAADPLPDAAAKEAGLDVAVPFAEKGLAVAASKPDGMEQAEYDQLKALAVPTFYSTLANDAYGKKDYATAITNFKKELASVPVEQTQTPVPFLVDTLQLAQAYMNSAPPDLVACSFYAARFVAYAPDQFKPAGQQYANYCYKKFHGQDMAEYDSKVVPAAKAGIEPPAGFSLTPAKKPADIAHDVVTSTPDLTTLAQEDREFILANGTKEDADKMFSALKGKTYKITDAVVIAAPSATQLQVAVSDDAQVNKTADVTVNLKALEAPAEPSSKAPAVVAKYKREKKEYDDKLAALTTATAVGSKVSFSGTYDSYVTTPTLMIIMNDGDVELPEAKKPAAHTAPVHKPAAGKR